MTGSSSHKSSGGNGANHASQQQRQGGSQNSTQRMQPLQMQQQQSKSQIHSKSSKSGSIPANPLAPAPSSLARATSTTSSTTTNSLARSKSKSGMPLPTTLKSSTSSIGSNGPTANTSSVSTPNTEQMTQQLLAKCDWKDKTIWAARQLLGGNATNGFLRATASVQRIKRQRARQTAHSKQKAEKAAAKDDGAKDKDANHNDGGKDGNEALAASGKKREAPDQASEETLKKEIMNPRTAKKIRAELQAGLNWCVSLQNSIRSILFEIDPTIAHHTPLPLIQGGEIPTIKEIAEVKAKANAVVVAAPPAPASVPSNPPAPTSSTTATKATTTTTTKVAPEASPPSSSSPQKQQQRRGSEKASTNSAKNAAPASQASPGESSGSTLRKQRKKKLPPCTEPEIELPEFDIGGKKYSRKEHFFRVFECTRFRALKVGDFVAARVSSRDLWILARVQKDYPGFTVSPADFLKLSEARRDALFKDKVAIKDVEDKSEGGMTMVPRNLVLPLPRTFSEAAEWAHRSMKKSRVYAMYPNTTSLYSATVVDNTTYCRGDDDIIVVEFDGDEAVDASGILPKYHIPARFVTLIPREFPAAQTNSKKRKSTTQAPALPNATTNALDTPSSVKSIKSEASLGLDDGLGGMVNSMGLDDLVTTDSLEDFGFDFSED